MNTTDRLINALITAINNDDIVAMGGLIDSLVATGTPSKDLDAALAGFDGDDDDPSDIELALADMGY